MEKLLITESEASKLFKRFHSDIAQRSRLFQRV